MIKLENVSTRQLIETLYQLKSQSINKTYEEEYNFLVNNHIYDYQILKELLDSETIQDDYVIILKRELNLVEEKISKSNQLGKTPKIYTYDTYNHCNVEQKTLEITDESNYGDVLIPSSLFRDTSAKSATINNITIKELKYLSSHLSRYRLKNELIDKRNFGNSTVDKIVKRIIFYEQQVLRQAKETNKRDINLFMLNKKEKDQIVESELEAIINYIITCNEKFIWGTVTEEQKVKMIRILSSPLSKIVKQDKKMLINIISNYTTIKELEDGIVKNKTLTRFIIK